MKSIALLLIVSLLFSLNSNSQSWVEDDAVWHYDYSITGSGFYKIELGNDTVISGKNCQKYLTKQYQFFPQPGGVFVEGPVLDLPSKFTHTSGDTVFYYQNNKFYTLFNFGAQIGDQWIIDDEYQTTGMTGCNLESIVEVIDTDNIDINGTLRRAILIETLNGSPLGMNGWVVENIGPIGSQYLFPTPRNCTAATFVDFERHDFKCFQDSRINRYNPSGIDCEYLLTQLGISENKTQYFQIYPNPATDVINIHFNKAGTYKLTLIDPTGRAILNQKLSQMKEEIYITELPPGMYTIKIENAKNEVSIARFFRN
jgi:hypothetical protein